MKARSTTTYLQAVYRDAGHLDDEAGRSAQQLRVILSELARLQAASAIERCVIATYQMKASKALQQTHNKQATYFVSFVKRQILPESKREIDLHFSIGQNPIGGYN